MEEKRFTKKNFLKSIDQGFWNLKMIFLILNFPWVLATYTEFTIKLFNNI